MARRKKQDTALTPLELDIMKALWEIGPANVQAVQAKLADRKLAYTTVQTMLNVLHRKGKVRRELKDRAYLYSAVLSRQKAVAEAVADVLRRFFAGSAESLVVNLLEAHNLSEEKLHHIRAMLEARKGKHGKE